MARERAQPHRAGSAPRGRRRGDAGRGVPLQQRQEERPFLGDAIAFEYLAVLPRGEEARAILTGEQEWSGRPERWLGGVHVPAGTSGPRYDPDTRRVA